MNTRRNLSAKQVCYRPILQRRYLLFFFATVIVLLFFSACDVDRGTKPEVICISNLKQIDTSKQIWVIEQNKSTNDIPTWNDLRPYFLGDLPPKCPERGTYSIGRVGELPTCSVNAHMTAFRALKPK